MTPDTTALRAQAKRYALFVPEVPLDTFYALCDGYDEAQRLRADAEMSRRAIDTYVGALAVERKRSAALVADLRALVEEYGDDFEPEDRWRYDRDLRAVIDCHAPATPTTEEDR